MCVCVCVCVRVCCFTRTCEYTVYGFKRTREYSVLLHKDTRTQYTCPVTAPPAFFFPHPTFIYAYLPLVSVIPRPCSTHVSFVQLTQILKENPNITHEWVFPEQGQCEGHVF